MPLIPKDKNTEAFRNAVGVFETDLNLVIDTLRTKLISDGWTWDDIGFLVVQLLREVQVKDEHGQALEYP